MSTLSSKHRSAFATPWLTPLYLSLALRVKVLALSLVGRILGGLAHAGTAHAVAGTNLDPFHGGHSPLPAQCTLSPQPGHISSSVPPHSHSRFLEDSSFRLAMQRPFLQEGTLLPSSMPSTIHGIAPPSGVTIWPLRGAGAPRGRASCPPCTSLCPSPLAQGSVSTSVLPASSGQWGSTTAMETGQTWDRSWTPNRVQHAGPFLPARMRTLLPTSPGGKATRETVFGQRVMQILIFKVTPVW